MRVITTEEYFGRLDGLSLGAGMPIQALARAALRYEQLVKRAGLSSRLRLTCFALGRKPQSRKNIAVARTYAEAIAIVTCVLLQTSVSTPANSTPRFFDSIHGDDGSFCSANSPCKTLARYRTVADIGDPMVLVDGSVFREQVPYLGSVEIRRSQTGANPPAVSGADVLRGDWVKENENLWYNVGIPEDPVVVFHDSMVGDGQTVGRQPRKTAKSQLSRQWDYFWDPEFGRLYIFSTDNPSKLSNLIEYGVRDRYIETVFADNTSVDGIYFYGTRDGIGILAFNSGASEIKWIKITRCIFGPSGGQHIQFNGASGIVDGNTFKDWNVEGKSNYYAWQGISGAEIQGEGTVVRGNSFELTIGRPTLKGGREPIDSGAITSDTGFWTREISNNKIVLNGLGLGILIYRPATWAKIIVIDNNTVEGSTTMSLDLSDFLTNNAVSQIIVSRNRFINSSCDDLLDTEAVRIRDLGEASVKFTSNLIWRTAVGKNLHPAIGIKNVKASIEIIRNTIYDTGKGIVLNGAVYGKI